MNTRGLLFLCVLSFSLTFFSCKDDPSSIGLTLLTDDKVEIKFVDSYQDSIPQYSSFFKSRLNLGTDESLLIGKIKNLVASSFVRFSFSVPDSIKQELLQDKIQILEAMVELVLNYKLGDDEEPFAFSVHKINSDWTSAGFNEDSLQLLSYDANDISNDVELTDSLLTFKITNELVLGWLKAQAEGNTSVNKGIYLKPGTMQKKALGFDALNFALEDIPIIKVVLSKPGVYTDTLIFFVTEDISVVSGEIDSFNPENIVVQAGLATHSKLVFDLSAIPEDATVLFAELVMTLDTLESVLSEGFTNRISAFYLKDSTTAEIDEKRRVDFTTTGNTIKANFTSFIQAWRFFKENNGVLLRAFAERHSLDTFIINGSTDQDPLLRPRLKITYSGKN